MSGVAPQKSMTSEAGIPRHIAIIMDGNGRWAERCGLPRTAGHRQGVEAVRRTVRAAGELGVEFLTLYSFSTENWNRPESEISELFSLIRMFIRRDLADLHKNNVIIRIIGDRDRVPEDLLMLLDDAKTSISMQLPVFCSFHSKRLLKFINIENIFATKILYKMSVRPSVIFPSISMQFPVFCSFHSKRFFIFIWKDNHIGTRKMYKMFFV